MNLPRFLQSVIRPAGSGDRQAGQSLLEPGLFCADPKLLIAPTPKVLWIELSSKCPFDCVFCSRKLRWGTGVHMEFEIYQSLLQELESPEIIRLNYSGESTTYPHLLEAIDIAASTGASTELVTALSSVSPSLLKKIAESPLDRLSVSLHTLDDNQYEDIYRYGSVGQLQRLIRQFCDTRDSHCGIGPQLDFCFVAMNDNLPQLSPIADYAAEVGVREIFIHPVIQRHPLPNSFSRELNDNRLTENFKAELRETTECVQSHRPEVSLMILNPSVFPTPPLQETPRPFASNLPDDARIHTCDQNPWETIHVLANGDVVACEVHDEVPLGNLYRKSLRKIWQDEEYRRFRVQYINGEMAKCRQCPWKTAFRPAAWRSSIDVAAGIGPQLGRGWYFEESGPILWSKHQATLALANVPQGNRLDVTGILPPSFKNPENRLRVECNGTNAGEVTNNSKQLLSFERSFELDPYGARFLSLQFSVQDAYRPCDHGANGDRRQLGFALSRIRACRSR